MGMIQKFGDKKMNLMRQKTIHRQQEITKICKTISSLTVEKKLTMLPELVSDLGTANTSYFILKQIPSDFLFLNDIFE